jgi:hypothetical protein
MGDVFAGFGLGGYVLSDLRLARSTRTSLDQFGSQASGGALTAMRGTIVDDEEHLTSGSIRFSAIDLSDETLECHAALAFAAAEQLAAMHIGCEVSQRCGCRGPS